jgi:hypothetical protein
MKNPVKIILAALFLIFNISCQKTKDKVNDAVEFDINYTTTQSIPSSSVSASVPLEFYTPEIPTNSSSTFASYNTSQEVIDKIIMTKFQITNQTGNLNFLKSISVYIKATGVNEVLVATKSSIPAGSTTVLCDMTGANIKEHIFKDKIQFRISVTVNSAPTTDQTLKLDQTVHVDGKIL